MKRIKLLYIITIVILICIFSTGCWNYSEINDKGLIMGAALDYDAENNLFVLTAELSSTQIKGNETQITSEYITGKGKSCLDSTRNIISTVGKKLLWGHTKVIIISEEVAKKEEILISLLDFLKRDAEPRDDTLLLLSREKTASELFQKVKSPIDQITSLYYEQTLRSQPSISKFPQMPLWKFVDELSSKGISAVLPTIKLNQVEDIVLAKIYGTAVFKGPQLIGYLEEDESKYFLMIKDELKGGLFPTEETDGSHPITLEVFESKTSKKPVYKNGQLTIKINISTTVSISEIQSTIDYTKKEKMDQLKKDTQRLFEKKVANTIRKAQNLYHSDIFGFGNIVEREMPDLWKKIESNWDKTFTDLKFEVDVTLNIRGTMLRSKTIKVGG